MNTYITSGVCARKIDFELSDDKKTIEHIEFTGGCDGNLKAIAKLLEGADTKETIETLSGNTCGNRSTSCADQLAKALAQAISE